MKSPRRSSPLLAQNGIILCADADLFLYRDDLVVSAAADGGDEGGAQADVAVAL